MNTKNYISGIACVVALLLFGAQYGHAQNYPALTESRLVFQGDKGAWDDNKVHTMTVVEANKDGFKYWAYYGLSHYGGDPNVRKAGLARSNDLEHWVKFDGNPIIPSDCRWPSVVYANNTFYMFYAEYNAMNDSRIVMLSSEDGIHFVNKVEVVAREKGKQNQNPNIFFDAKDKCFYLSYYHGLEREDTSAEAKMKKAAPVKKFWSIALKKSKTVEGLAAAAPKTLLKSDFTLASPSIVKFANKYRLIVEASKAGVWDDKWVTIAYEANKIEGPYKKSQNSLILSDNDACAFQHVFDNQLYIFYSHCLNLNNWDWELRMVKSQQ